LINFTVAMASFDLTFPQKRLVITLQRVNIGAGALNWLKVSTAETYWNNER
jgi:hypothetical protein